MDNDERQLLLDRGGIEPGEYDCEWIINGERAKGHINLRSDRPSLGEARVELIEGKVPGRPGHYARSYPSYVEAPIVRGYIDSQRKHITFFDVTLTAWFSERTRVAGAIALVTDDEIPDDIVFTRMSAQITKLEQFSGLAPIASHTRDAAGPPHEFGITTTGLKREWPGDSMSATFYYGWRSSLDPYVMSVRFTPWIEFTAAKGMAAGDWLRSWCLPLVEMISVSSGEREKAAFVSLKTENDEPITAAVFASPITQAPYYLEGKPSDILAFTASDDGFSIVQALRLWNEHREAGHPLIVGYNTVALGKDQHPQARLLLLLQWLEASYGFHHRDEFAAKQKQHTITRDSLIAKLRAMKDDGALTNEEFRLAKRVPKRAEPTLLQALSASFDSHRDLDTESKLCKLSLISSEIESGRESAADALRVIRNGLSHGTKSYAAHGLLEIVEVLHTLVRAEYLRILGGSFDTRALR